MCGSCQWRCERLTDRFRWVAQWVSVTIPRIILSELTVLFEGKIVNCDCAALVLRHVAVETNETVFVDWELCGRTKLSEVNIMDEGNP